jgi:hypothetical protein
MAKINKLLIYQNNVGAIVRFTTLSEGSFFISKSGVNYFFENEDV